MNALFRPLLAATITFLLLPTESWSQTDAITRLPVVISGGHETDPRDHGRPVILVAGGLGVSPAVFREAFSRVHPVTAGSYPDQERARENKTVLLEALSKYGITNQKLDAVSDAYRYNPGSGQLWPTKPAVIAALVKNGKVISYEVIDGGAGYSSPPNLSFGQNLSTNGSISSVTFLK